MKIFKIASVGGLITEVIKRKGKVWVNTNDGSEECAVYCADDGHDIKAGDQLWWQAGSCYYTPKNGTEEDIEIEKIGGSGVERP